MAKERMIEALGEDRLLPGVWDEHLVAWKGYPVHCGVALDSADEAGWIKRYIGRSR